MLILNCYANFFTHLNVHYYTHYNKRKTKKQILANRKANSKLNVYWPNQKYAAAATKSFQLCPTLCDPRDGSPPSSPVPGILQARILEWVAISFSNAWTWKVKVKLLSRVRLWATSWTAAYQAPPSMGFPRQEYWSGVPLPSPRGWFSIGLVLSGPMALVPSDMIRPRYLTDFWQSWAFSFDAV